MTFALPQRTHQIIKSFCFFFQKEALLLALACAPAKAAAVVSLNLCTDQLLVLLAPEQIRALEPLARDPALSFVATQAQSLPMVRADAEAVLALHPDLVLAGRYGAQATLALLRARGVRVVQVDQPASFAQVAAEVAEIAHVLGEEARGAALVARMWQRLAAVHPRAGTAVMWEAGGWSAGPGGFEDAVMRAAGLTNLGTGGRIGLEALLAARPGLLITERASRFPSIATDLAWHPALAGMARLTVLPAWLACAGPFSVAAVEALAGG